MLNIYGVAVLQNERKPYWNTTCGLNLVIVVINTSSADTKLLLLLSCAIQLENCIGIHHKDYRANSSVQYKYTA